jgi:hypothetical protein
LVLTQPLTPDYGVYFRGALAARKRVRVEHIQALAKSLRRIEQAVLDRAREIPLYENC